MALESYRNRVETLASDRSGDPVFNGSMDHAEIIVENMFAHAEKHVNILTGKLNARVYGTEEVKEEARLFLADAENKVQILMEEVDMADLKDHPFFDEFHNYDNVVVREVPKELSSLYDFHFLVMDGDSYRFEEDKTKTAAVAAFGEPTGAANMERTFKRIWAAGKPVSLPQTKVDDKKSSGASTS